MVGEYTIFPLSFPRSPASLPLCCLLQFDAEQAIWITGKITKWNADQRVYTVNYPNASQLLPLEYDERTIIEPVLMANIGVGTKISIYSYSDDAFYGAEIKEVDDTRLDNLLADFESGMSENIDLRRFKYHILNAPNGKVVTTSDESNLAVISERAPRSMTPEAVEPLPPPDPALQQQQHQPPPPLASTKDAAGAEKTTVSRDHPFPNIRGVSGPATSNVAFVDRGTIVAIRWKRPYILYDATVVKMKDDGSQYLLQYHYDSATKWVDLNKSEFYVIGVDATFTALLDDGASRATRRGVRKSDGPSAAHAPATGNAEDGPRKRPRRSSSVPLVDNIATKTADETPVQTVNEREMGGFHLESVQQLSVGSRIAVWSRYKEYRKATVKSFSENRDDFEIQYDTDKPGRKIKINLKQNPFLILKPASRFPTELDTHENPDLSLVEIGTKISVLWEGETKFYPATVARISDGEKPYYLEYEDGDVEWIDLASNKFKIVE